MDAVEISNGSNIELSGIKATPGTTVVRAGFSVSKVDGFKFSHCEANGGISGGFVVTRSNGELFKCIAHDVGDATHQQSDGFNFHETGYTLLTDCIAYNCADDGVSHHDNTIGTIIGGEFYNCGTSDGGNTRGGGIAPAGHAKVHTYDVYVHDCFRGLEVTGTDCETITANSAFKNNNAVDLYISTTEATIINVKYDTKRVTDGSTLVEI